MLPRGTTSATLARFVAGANAAVKSPGPPHRRTADPATGPDQHRVGR